MTAHLLTTWLTEYLSLLLRLNVQKKKKKKRPLSKYYCSLTLHLVTHGLWWRCCCLVAKSCLFATPWTVAFQAPLSSTVSQSLVKFISSESVMLFDHLILSCPLLRLIEACKQNSYSAAHESKSNFDSQVLLLILKNIFYNAIAATDSDCFDGSEES